MATPAGPISTPAPAAPAAAPAAAPISTPASIPASSVPAGLPAAAPASTGVPAAPAGAPSPGDGPLPAAAVTTGDAPAAPAAPAGPQPGAEPKASDFANTGDGQQEFLTARHKWQAEQAAKAGEPAKPAEVPAAAEPEAPPVPPPGEPAKPPVPEVAATPQELSAMMDAKPEFKALLDKDPELKATVFANARELAAAKPVLDIFPTADDAMFAQEYQQAMVGMRTAAMMAVEDPAQLPTFLTQFDSQFAIVDKDGNPVLNAQGQPSYAADRDVVVNGLVSREVQGHQTRLTTELNALKQKLATGVYPNETAKELDQKRHDDIEWASQALGIIPHIMDGSYFNEVAPEIPADASPAFKAWAEAKSAEIAKQKEELEAAKQGGKKEERATERVKFNEQVRGGYATAVGTLIGKELAAVVEAGVYIPEFYLQQKYVNPQTGQETGTSDIAARIFLQFENELRAPGSRSLMTITEHELLPRNEQTKQVRLDWYNKQMATKIPKLIKAEVDRIQKLVKLDQDKQAGRAEARSQAAQPEPNSGGSSLPQGQSREQMLQLAEANAKARPDYAASSDKQAILLTEYHKLRDRR